MKAHRQCVTFLEKINALDFILHIKAELLREGIIFLIHLFAREILLIKKLNIKETRAT